MTQRDCVAISSCRSKSVAGCDRWMARRISQQARIGIYSRLLWVAVLPRIAGVAVLGAAVTRINRKPGVTARVRAAKARKDAAYAKKIRQLVAERDGYCRLHGIYCQGPSEWAHLGEKKRFNTRGLPPNERHTTAGSLMLCARHHDWYDIGKMHICGEDANGPLEITCSGFSTTISHPRRDSHV